MNKVFLCLGWAHLLPWECSTLLCSSVEGPAGGAVELLVLLVELGLIQGRESSAAPPEVVVVAVMVTWIM